MMDTMTAGDESRWQAVAARDPEADGHFYFSVRTTGIYCRPSCGARLPRRENVAFHDSCEAAAGVLGTTATRFRAGGAGETVRFAVGQCSLGAILVAATDRGIAAIAFCDDPDALLKGLQDRFPRARLLVGYRWGVARKRALLDREAAG